MSNTTLENEFSTSEPVLIGSAIRSLRNIGGFILVLAVLRVNLHLERMADYCVTVAKLTKLICSSAKIDSPVSPSGRSSGAMR